MKIHRPQWSTAKPLIQWQWLDSKKPLKNHWYQWFKFDKIIDDNGWIVKLLEKTIGYNGFFSKTIDHSIVLKKWPSLWSSSRDTRVLGSANITLCSKLPQKNLPFIFLFIVGYEMLTTLVIICLILFKREYFLVARLRSWFFSDDRVKSLHTNLKTQN